MRFRKILSATNWRYALGEVFLIFVGITMAIWFNNWNESRRAKEVEIETIEELLEATGNDLLDIRENIEGFAARVELYELLLDHFEHQRPLTDSLRERLPYFQGITTFIASSGAYETLKSRGLDIISNDSLRLQIANYYDREYDRILSNEMEHHLHVREYLKPKFLEHFELENFRMQPLNYQAMIQDQELRQIVAWAWRNNVYMRSCYQTMEEFCLLLQRNLMREYRRLN